MNDFGASFCRIEIGDDFFLKEALPDFREEMIHEIRWLTEYTSPAMLTYLPKVLDYSLFGKRVFLKTKRYNYPTLRTLLFTQQLNTELLAFILKDILIKLDLYLYTEKNSLLPYSGYVRETHFVKLKTRLALALQKNPELESLLLAEEVIINERKVRGLPTIISFLEEHKTLQELLLPHHLFLIHGDLHLNNILYSLPTHHFILLDPRGRSPGQSVECDIAYDIAKILHDLHGKYSLIHRGCFDLMVTKTLPFSLKFTVHSGAVFDVLEKTWQQLQFLVPQEIQKKMGANWLFRSLFIEATLFCTMLPFYSNNIFLQTIFLANGLLLFDHLLGIPLE